MNRSVRDPGSVVVGRRRQRLLVVLLAASIAFPTAAYPYTLDQLLRLPLEQLLQLKFAASRISTATADGALANGIQGNTGHGHVA